MAFISVLKTKKRHQSFLCPPCEDVARRQLSVTQEAGPLQISNLLAP